MFSFLASHDIKFKFRCYFSRKIIIFLGVKSVVEKKVREEIAPSSLSLTWQS